jgi:hypothetical protein
VFQTASVSAPFTDEFRAAQYSGDSPRRFSSNPAHCQSLRKALAAQAAIAHTLRPDRPDKREEAKDKRQGQTPRLSRLVIPCCLSHFHNFYLLSPSTTFPAYIAIVFNRKLQRHSWRNFFEASG